MLFKKVPCKNRRGLASNNFGKLIEDAVFLNRNVYKVDFMAGVMISKTVLKGNIYYSNMQPSLSDVTDAEEFKDSLDLVHMLFLNTSKDSLEVLQTEYISHIVTDTYLEILLANGEIKRLNFY